MVNECRTISIQEKNKNSKSIWKNYFFSSFRDFYLSKTDIDFLKAKPDFVFFDEYISENGYEPIES